MSKYPSPNSGPHPAEMAGKRQGHDERAEAGERPFRDHDASFRRKGEHEGEAAGEVQEAPEDIDHGRRFADARRRGERALKRMAADPLDEMRDAVGEQQSTDELQEV